MRAIIALPVVASLVLASAVCRADDVVPPPPSAPESAPPAHVWYGYQTLGTDAVALALLVPAAANSNLAAQQGFEVGSLLMYTAAAPIVHFVHGHVGKGFLDLGVRAGLPLVGAVTGVAIVEAMPRPDCNSPANASQTACQPFGLLAEAIMGGLIGTGLGVIGAVTFDAAVLGRETVPQDEARPAPQPAVAHVSPTFSLL